MVSNLRLEHIRFYKLLARLPHFILSHISGFKIVPKPIMMVWEATYRCPARCTSCDRWRIGKIEAELTTTEAEHLIDNAIALGVKLLVVSGGDPLARSDVISMGGYARAKGMLTVLCTTGALIHEGNIQEIMKSFDVFELPLDSLNPELHDRLRGRKGIFERTMTALELLLSRRQPWHGIEITTVVRDENYQEVGEINRRFASLGIVTAMQPLHQGLYGAITKDHFEWAAGYEDNWNKMVDNYQWCDGFSKLALESFFRQIPVYVQTPDKLRNTYICFAGSYSLIVDPNGNVFLCDVLRRPVGNIRDKPLKDIWSSLYSLRSAVSSSTRKCNCWLLCTTPPSLFLSRYTLR
jgi:MoaA/NifB/PqqE/SkfB family radical SAM enzyme